jgi:hypothetical protein
MTLLILTRSAASTPADEVEISQVIIDVATTVSTAPAATPIAPLLVSSIAALLLLLHVFLELLKVTTSFGASGAAEVDSFIYCCLDRARRVVGGIGFLVELALQLFNGCLQSLDVFCGDFGEQEARYFPSGETPDCFAMISSARLWDVAIASSSSAISAR